MKQLVLLSHNIIIHSEVKEPLIEFVMILSEDDYQFNENKELKGRDKLETIRFVSQLSGLQRFKDEIEQIENEIKNNDSAKAVKLKQTIMDFAAWIEDNHHSFKIPCRILQDYIKHGG